MTPLVRRIGKLFDGPDDCSVGAVAQLERGGSIRVQLFARR